MSWPMKNKKLQAKIIVIALLVGMLFTFTHCVTNEPVDSATSAKRLPGSETPTGPSSPSPSPAPSPGPAPLPTPTVQVDALSVGIRHHEQLYQTFAELTGIPAGNWGMRQHYKHVTGSLPTTNNVQTFLSSNQVAVTRLASEFCGLMMDTTQVDGVTHRRGEIIQGVNIDQALSSFTTASRTLVASNIVNTFFGQDILSPEEEDAAIAELVDVMNRLSVTVNGSPAPDVRSIIKGACTVALSSGYVTLI